MAKIKYTLTRQGYEQLQREYDQLKNIDRPAMLKHMEEARALGDLKENGAYHAARSSLAMIQGRMEELETIMHSPDIIDEAETDGTIAIGSVVELIAGQETKELTLVGEQEADVTVGRISADSPLGQALLGARAGETVMFEAPSGSIEFEVKSVK